MEIQKKKQDSVLLSTTELEYYVLGITCQEAAWIKQIFQEVIMPLNDPILIYSDNTSAVALSNNPIFITGQNKLTFTGTLSEISSTRKLFTPCTSPEYKTAWTS